MSKCVRTGVDVFISDYNAGVRADIHDADGVIVINYNPDSWTHLVAKSLCEVHVHVGHGYMHKEKGLIVNPTVYAYKPKH